MINHCKKCQAEIEYTPIPGCAGFGPSICDDCEEERQKAKAVEEQDKRKARLIKALKTAEVPSNYWSFDETLGNTDLLGFCWENRDSGIYLAAGTGMGKTRCLCRTAVRMLWENPNLKALYLPTVDWIRETCGMMGYDQREAEDRIRRAKRVDVLILDDMCQERYTERGREVLFAVVDGRLREGRKFWITTNGMAGEIDEKLGEVKGKAIRRRIMQTCCEYWGDHTVTEAADNVFDGLDQQEDRR